MDAFEKEEDTDGITHYLFRHFPLLYFLDIRTFVVSLSPWHCLLVTASFSIHSF